MKVFYFLIIFSIVLLAANAEPPRLQFKKLKRNFQRQQLEPTTTTENSIDFTTNQSETGPYPPAAMAPYPPSGYRPNRAFTLPTERNSTESVTTTSTDELMSGPYSPSGWKPNGQQFKLPTSNYGSPKPEYNIPTETYEPTQQDDDTIQVDADNNEPFEDQENYYFITLPDGTVQKISYKIPSKGKIELKAETLGRIIQSNGVENPSGPRTVSYVQQYQSW